MYRLAARAGARPVLEPDNLLPTAPHLRSLPDVPRSSWRRFPKLALDCAVTSPFQSATLRASTAGALAAADRYADLKREHSDMKTRCEQQNLGFEPLILESTGGLSDETRRLLQTMSALVDRKEQRLSGSTWHDLTVRLSVDLQRGPGPALSSASVKTGEAASRGGLYGHLCVRILVRTLFAKVCTLRKLLRNR